MLDIFALTTNIWLEVHFDKVPTFLSRWAPFSTKIEAILQEVVIAYVSDYPTIVRRGVQPQSGGWR